MSRCIRDSSRSLSHSRTYQYALQPVQYHSRTVSYLHSPLLGLPTFSVHATISASACNIFPRARLDLTSTAHCADCSPAASSDLQYHCTYCKFVEFESSHLTKATAVHNIYNLKASRLPNLCASSFAITESLHFKLHDHRIFAFRALRSPNLCTSAPQASRSSNLCTKKLPHCHSKTHCLAVGPPLKRHSHNCHETPTQQASSAVVGPPLKRQLS